MKHQHDDCDHNLKHCAKCDEVYCTKCDVTWPRYHQKSYPYWGYPYYYTYGSGISNDNVILCGTQTNGFSQASTLNDAVFNLDDLDHKHS